MCGQVHALRIAVTLRLRENNWSFNGAHAIWKGNLEKKKVHAIIYRKYIKRPNENARTKVSDNAFFNSILSCDATPAFTSMTHCASNKERHHVMTTFRISLRDSKIEIRSLITRPRRLRQELFNSPSAVLQRCPIVFIFALRVWLAMLKVTQCGWSNVSFWTGEKKKRP